MYSDMNYDMPEMLGDGAVPIWSQFKATCSVVKVFYYIFKMGVLILIFIAKEVF